MDKVSRLLAHRIEVLRLSQEIGRQTKAALDERQREVLLREQMAAIQRQLGEGDEGKAAEMAELDAAITKASMPKEIEDQARKELRRLAAHAGSRRRIRHGAHLSRLADRAAVGLPEEKPIDIIEARRILDEDHYDLDKIKRRIIEYLAVRKLAPQGKAPILCFVGPPGVGKTSLGQSIARAMDRKFVRVSPRRRARRGGDPRPSPDLYRRAARQHHSGDPQGRHAQLRDDARRDRQARRRHPRRSLRGAARSARSGAEQHVPR